MNDSPEPLEPPTGVPRIRRLVIGGVVLGVVVFWLLIAGGRLFEARDLALAGVDRLEGLRGRLDMDDVIERTIIPDLEAAAADLQAANDKVRSPVIAPLRLVPWVGTQVRSADALSAAAGTATSALAEAADDVAGLAESGSASDRVAIAVEGLAIIRRARETLDRLDLGPSDGLTRSLFDARERFSNEVEETDGLLSDAETATTGLAGFLEGPTTYLLLAANNSEMRAGSGSYLQVGTLTVTNGSLSVSPLRPAGDILLERGAVPIADEDLADRWGWLDIASDWRNLSLSPRFPASAELGAAMWRQLEAESVDGVFVIDPVALSEIMSVAGPVEVDGRTISASDVVRELLFDQYWEEDVETRRDRLDEIARATFGVVESADVDLVTLARNLQAAAAGRHLLAWSDQPAQQAAWLVVGVDGGLSAESVAVSVLNQGANKLDPFLTVDAQLSAELFDSERLITLTLTLDNSAQAAFPPYVLGPAAAFGYDPGTYAGFLSVNVPGRARQPAFTDGGTLVAEGTDGATRVVAIDVQVPAGGTVVHELTFRLPLDSAVLRIEPSARVPGITWHAMDAEWVDQEAAVVDLETGAIEGAVDLAAPGRIAFDRDPIEIPAAPIPWLAIDGNEETTVIVSWRDVAAEVDVWERKTGEEWVLVADAIPIAPVMLSDRVRRTEYCYRTAFTSRPDEFSAVECTTLPAPLGFVRFDGDPASYFSAADFIGPGDLDVRMLVAPDQWTPDAWQMFAGQYNSAANDRSWRFGIDVFDSLVANFSPDGVNDGGANRGFPVSFRDGRREWVRMTVEPERGRLRFWVSRDGVDWSQLGEDRRFDPIGALFDSRGPVYVGTDRPGSDNSFAGKLYYFEVRQGIDGPILADLDFREAAGDPGRWVDSAGNVFTARGTGWEYVTPGD
ncbi:MAG: DUF4012 domain-containing protein [Acidimicrobiia bacterium]|nr:DUF4012 domain-containing protein [Acidimicrobiia bacterium]